MPASVLLARKLNLKTHFKTENGDYTCCYKYLKKKFFYIECSIAGAHEKIAECKKQILQAKRIRKNRQGKGFVGCSMQILHY